MKECLRLNKDSEIKSIERKMIKTTTLEKDTNGQSDAEEQHEEYNAPLIGTEKIDTSKRTTMSSHAPSITQFSGAYDTFGCGIRQLGGRHGQAEERTTRIGLAVRRRLGRTSRSRRGAQLFGSTPSRALRHIAGDADRA